MKLIEGMAGVGDSVYQRPFVKEICKRNDVVYLRTPWPQFYKDIPNIKFLKMNTKYRTQMMNIARTDRTVWAKEPTVDRKDVIRFRYGVEELCRWSILETFGKQADLEDLKEFEFDLPIMEAKYQLDNGNKPVAVVKPVTHRKEWYTPSRSPNPLYLAWCARQLQEMGYYVVSIASNQVNSEWCEPPLPPSDHASLDGGMSMEQAIEVIRSAKVVVGYPSWVLPVSIAVKTPLFLIYGGRGAYDTPTKLLDRRMDLSKVHNAIPDKFCECDQSIHKCSKEIKNLAAQFNQFMATL